MEMRDYLDAAKRQRGCKTDYELARVLGVTRQTVNQLRKGTFTPGAELMVRIAMAADSEADLALTHLNYWRSRHGKAKEVYRKLMEKLEGTTLALAFAFGIMTGVTFMAPRPALAFNNSVGTLYIMGRKRKP